MTDRPLSPCVDQTPAEIEAYYRTAPIGAPAAVRSTQYGCLRYDIRVIEGRNERAGRIYVAQDGAFYMKSGKNCYAPTGQITLVVPTEAVLAWAAANPQGVIGVSTFRLEDLPPWAVGRRS